MAARFVPLGPVPALPVLTRSGLPARCALPGVFAATPGMGVRRSPLTSQIRSIAFGRRIKGIHPSVRALTGRLAGGTQRSSVLPPALPLAQLPLVSVGDTGTIQFESSARTRVRARGSCQRICDSAQGSGNGCYLFSLARRFVCTGMVP